MITPPTRFHCVLHNWSRSNWMWRTATWRCSPSPWRKRMWQYSRRRWSESWKYPSTSTTKWCTALSATIKRCWPWKCPFICPLKSAPWGPPSYQYWTTPVARGRSDWLFPSVRISPKTTWRWNLTGRGVWSSRRATKLRSDCTDLR